MTALRRNSAKRSTTATPALEVGEVLHESGAEEEVGEALAEAPV